MWQKNRNYEKESDGNSRIEKTNLSGRYSLIAQTQLKGELVNWKKYERMRNAEQNMRDVWDIMKVSGIQLEPQKESMSRMQTIY